MIAKPALNTAALVILRTSALFAVIVTALEAVNVELAHIRTESLKVLYKFAV